MVLSAAMLMLVTATLVVSCSGKPQAEDRGVRIVSFSPAITKTVIDLGLADLLVGRTGYCEDPGDVHVVGNLHEIDHERLLKLRPTHVLVQRTVTGNHHELERICDRHGITCTSIPMDTIPEISDMLVQVPGLLLKPGVDDELLEVATQRATAIIESLEQLERMQTCGSGDPSILLFSVDPPRAFGRGTYIDQLYRQLGGANCIMTEGYPELAMEDLYRIDPAELLVICSSSTDAEAARAHLNRAWPDSVHRTRWIIEPELLIPSSRVIQCAQQLCGASMPDRPEGGGA